MEAKEISQAVVSRLPRYFRYLGELKDEGVERISSQELSKLMRVTASQIRQDFNNFGGFGQQGYGYNVEYLYTEIGKILGLDQTHRLIIIGAGHLGQAIANYMNFERRGFLIKGLFDADPDLAGKMVRQIPVRPMEELEQFIQVNNIDIGVLTIPKDGAAAVSDRLVKCGIKSKAPEIAERLVKAGIKAIWNFAHLDLDVPDSVQVENVHLSDSLMKLSYNIRNSSGL